MIYREETCLHYLTSVRSDCISGVITFPCAWKSIEVHRSATPVYKDRTWDKKFEGKEPYHCAECHEMNMDSVLLQHLRPFCRLQCFIIFYRRKAQFPNVCRRALTLSDYISIMCMYKFIWQPLVGSAMSMMYSSLMMQSDCVHAHLRLRQSLSSQPL